MIGSRQVHLWVPARLPGQNELLAGRAHASRGWSEYNSTKQRLAAQVILLARVKGLSSIEPSFFTYLFVEPNRKRDPSNVASGGIKILEDAFVKGGFLENDGWSHVLGIQAHWICEPNRAGCLVHWGAELLTKEAMLLLLEKERENGNFNDRPGIARDESPRTRLAKAARRRA